MASALQKLFRKKLNRQSSAPDGRNRAMQEQISSKPNATSTTRQASDNDRQFLTVSSLNSPSVTPVHRGSFSSASSVLPSHQSHVQLSRTASNHSASRENKVDRYMPVPEQVARSLSVSDSLGVAIDQFGSLLISEDGLPTTMTLSSSSDDDEEDVQNNDFYKAMMDHLDAISSHDDVKIVLVPSARSLDALQDRSILALEAYMSLYAFIPSTLFKDRYQSVRRSSSFLQVEASAWKQVRAIATLQPEARSVSVVLKRQVEGKRKEVQEDKTFTVLSETIVFRSQSTISSSKKRERRKIRVLLIDGLLAADADSLQRRRSKGPASDASSKGTVTERQISAPSRPEGHSESSLAFPGLTNGPAGSKAILGPRFHVDATRNFLSDYLLLLDPPASLSCLKPAFRVALQILKKNSSDFTKAYVYVPGFDSYNASRIRRGILARSWHAFVEEARKSEVCSADLELSRWLGNEGRSRLLAVFENVVLGHCHSKIYMSIRSLQEDADDKLDFILATYHDHDVSLADLGLTQSVEVNASTLHASQNILRGLGEPEEDLDWSLRNKSVTELREMAALSRWDPSNMALFKALRHRLRTPLDVLDVMQMTLDGIGCAPSRTERARHTDNNERANATSSLGADELIPLLAFVLIRVSPRKVMSMLYYTRLFGVSDATSAKHAWALTMFEAVAQYLSSDPLTLCRGLRDRETKLAKVQTPASTMLERRSSEQQHDRSRRASLPSGTFLATDKSITATHAEHIPAAAKITTFASTSNFKQPGLPASQTVDSFQSRPSLLAGRSNSQDLVQEPVNELATYHKRTMSLSNDLLIRPQIVVRGTPGGRSDSRSSISSRPLLTRNVSSAISVATNEGGEPISDGNHRRKSASESWSLLGVLSGYGSSSKASLADVPTPDTTKHPTAPLPVDNGALDVNPSESRSPAVSSSGWLTGWAHEWTGMSRAPSSAGIERQNSTTSTSSRPQSVMSQESNSGGALSVPIRVSRANISRSVSPLGFPSMDSMPSLDTGPQSPRSDDLQHTSTTICSSPREPTSVLSSPSSVLSSPTYKSDQLHLKTNRGGSWSSTEPGPTSFVRVTGSSTAKSPLANRGRSRTRVRSRLLSGPMPPSTPLPPQVTSEAASADLSTSRTSADNVVRPASTVSHDLRFDEDLRRHHRPKPASTLSADHIAPHSSVDSMVSSARRSAELQRSRSTESQVRSVDKLADRRREPLAQTSSSTLNSNAWPSGQPLHTIKLQIPSPVDERSDPMTTAHAQRLI